MGKLLIFILFFFLHICASCTDPVGVVGHKSGLALKGLTTLVIFAPTAKSATTKLAA